MIELCTIIATSILSTILLYVPFISKIHNWMGLVIKNSDMTYVYRHFDGPLYVIAAKSWYNPAVIQSLHIELPIAPSYFAAHLPLYPFLISLASPVFGYLKSMLVVSVMGSAVFAVVFYIVLRRMNLTKSPLILVTVALFLPRFLVVRSVGSPESIFMTFILLSLFFFEEKKYLLAGLFGGIAVMTKSPGILLFFAYSLVFVEDFLKHKKVHFSWISILLIPLGLLGVFAIYWVQYGDFFAYFHSGDNIHLVYPYAVFNFQKTWVGTAWLEDVVFYFFLYISTVIALYNTRHRALFYFALVFLTATMFVQHRDIARYCLPMWPLACIAFEKQITNKKFLIAFLILAPAIYLYAWNFMLYNIMPISDWTAYL